MSPRGCLLSLRGPGQALEAVAAAPVTWAPHMLELPTNGLLPAGLCIPPVKCDL